MIVVKRDKTEEQFDIAKVESAVEKAFKSCGKPMDYGVIDCIKSTYDINSDGKVNVEDIQDSVENCLMGIDKDVAKSYIIYRYSHKVIRDENDKMHKAITKKLMASDVQNQNANVDEHSFGGRVGEVNRLVLKDYALKYCMSKKSRNNHLNNEIYIHDLDSYAIGDHNCLTYPLDESLAYGVTTRQTDIRPAKSISTAFQLLAVYFQIQSLQQFGGVSCSHLDWSMVPYVRMSYYKHFTEQYIRSKMADDGINPLSMSEEDRGEYDKKCREEFNEKYSISYEDFKIGDFSMRCVNFHVDDDKIKLINANWYTSALDATLTELEQSVEGMYHNLNSLQSRSGNQLPFSSINYGTCTLAEGRMVIRALLNGSLKGIGKLHKTPIFPCGIFQMMKGVNRHEGDPNYDLFKLALKSTSKRLYPNYANCDWSVNEGYDKNNPRTYMATMGCHAAGTKIIMKDGTFKNVEDVAIGDELMGVNNDVRVVKELIRGNGKMYKVHQSKGEDYVVNDGHVLALIFSRSKPYRGLKKGDKVNMTINDLLAIPEYVRRFFKGYKKCVGKKNAISDFLTSTLTISEIGYDNFYGFELDGDRLYMINDNTVTHNCRTYNGYDVNGFGQLKDGRGNLCPVTIILPTLAMEANEQYNKSDKSVDLIEVFMKLLAKKIGEAKDMLLERFDWLCKQSPKSAKFMWDNNTMFGYNKDEGIKSALKHGTLAIGQVGLAECLQALIGSDHTTAEGMALGERIEQLFNKKCADYKKKYMLNFGVYYTPAENLCNTALKKFRQKYGIIKGVSDREYFTNSMHVPVWKKMSPFEKIDIESRLTKYSNAGCITYIELPSTTKNNLEALEVIVNYAMDKDIPYFAINVPNDTCNNCGYTDEMNSSCPMCGSNLISRLRRVTGYLTGDFTTSFNAGKYAEVLDRVKHMDDLESIKS